MAARNENYKSLIKKNYNKKIILIDRFTDSTIAYQHYGMGINKKIILMLNKFILKNIKPNFTLLPKMILGFASGFISGPMGIGGAIINVPVLRYFGYPINKAIGSAATIGLIIAIFGALGFLISGLILKSNLPLSVGFINIPAFLIFIPITTLMARIGAKTTHKLDKYKLQNMFGVFLYIIGTVFLYRYLVL